MDGQAATTGQAGRTFLLDVTRLVSRAGRMPTGIDRVEQAWLSRLVAGPDRLFGLVRTPFGHLLLDRAGLARLDRGLPEDGSGGLDLLSRLQPRRPLAVRVAEAALRRVAIGRATRAGLARMLRRRLPAGVVACNVGHADLDRRTLAALKSVPGLRLTVMIHDTIPLDFPAFQRDGTVAAFRRKFDAAAAHADRILCPSRAAAEDVLRHLRPSGRAVPVDVAPLGVVPPVPQPEALPPGLPPEEPFFVAIGTIEPRKNHALLLDVWDRLGPSAPWLLICGSRGWRNADVFARLDQGPPRVREVPGLTDGAVAALLDGARALLFPSLAEGFGLPLAEAGARGTPVLCSDLPVCREVAGPQAEYLDPRDVGGWAGAILRLAGDRRARIVTPPPTWEEHFNIALGMA